MVNNKCKVLLLAAMAGAITMVAAAQVPRSAPPGSPFVIRSELDAARYRMLTITQQGLNSSALNLTTAQKARIDKILDAHVVEQVALQENYPLEPGARPSQATIQARQSSLDNLTAALGSVMNPEQRQTWQAAQAARRSTIEQVTSRPPPGVRRN